VTIEVGGGRCDDGRNRQLHRAQVLAAFVLEPGWVSLRGSSLKKPCLVKIHTSTLHDGCKVLFQDVFRSDGVGQALRQQLRT
jgi:hypothetical protein